MAAKSHRPIRRRSASGRFTRHNAPNPRRRHNPFRRRRRSYALAHYGHRRRRNPALARFGGGILPVVIGAGIGGVASRAIPQAILKDANSGLLGYAANAITALAGGALVGRFISRNAGYGFTIGGLAGTLMRFVSEYFGKTVLSLGDNGVGDNGVGAYGDRAFDLGMYQPTFFPLPTASQLPYGVQAGPLLAQTVVATNPLTQAMAPTPAVVPPSGYTARTRVSNAFASPFATVQ